MNKRGFTLIEVLSVIVVLSIIMVIAVPVTFSIVENAEKSAFKNDTETIVETLKLKYETRKIYSNELNNYKFVFPDDNIVELRGKKPAGGIVYYEKIDEKVDVIVDKLLSNRLIYSVRAYNEYGLNLLANIPALINKDKYIIDNFYILTIISYGIIIYLVLSLICKMFHKKADIYSKIIIIVAFIYLFFEALSFNGGLCIFITLLGYLFYKDKKNEGDVS